MDIQEKIKIVKKKLLPQVSIFQQDEIRAWEVEILEGIRVNSINEKEGIRQLVNKLEDKTKTINHTLITDRNLDDFNRSALFIVRDNLEWLIKIFDKVDYSQAEEQININFDDL